MITTIVQTLDLLCPGAPVEIRVLPSSGQMMVRRFDDHERAAEWAGSFTDAKASYLVMNPFDAKRIKEAAVDDESVTRRKWLLIDVDPERPSNTNATDEELAHVVAVAGRIKPHLAAAGWAEPIEAVSGNGAHLLSSIDLPNDDASTTLIENVLRYLATTFDDDKAHVDTVVANASRITKAYGSWTRKGPPTPERPHRLSAITRVPDPLIPVPLDALQRVADLAPKEPIPERTSGSLYDIGRVLARVEVIRTFRKGDTTCREIVCPWVREHSTGEGGTILTVGADGAMGFKCQHKHCENRRWKDVRDFLGIETEAWRHRDREYPYTETGDGEYFADLYDGRVAYDARRGRYLLIEEDSGLWLPDPVERLRGYAVATMRARQADANRIEDKEKREDAWTWGIKGESGYRLTSLLREARTQPAIRNDSILEPWDAPQPLLGVPDGVVDLRTGEQRKARPEERITMRAGIDYDPTAHSPLWEKTLLAISKDDPTWVSYLQRLGGYTTTGDTSQDRWFIKHGNRGREGKGTIDGAWSGALGDYVLELPSAVFELKPRGNPDFDLSYLPCKRFVLSSESGNTVHLHHDRIKQMTGGGSMRVANKYEKSFEFIPSCKLWLACNDLPTVTDDSSAFWARVIVIPFSRSFLGVEDTTLRPTLSNDPEHRRAVLAWLIKGAIDYYRDGLGEMPQRVRDATDAFRDVAWPLTPIVKEDCVLGDDARVSVGDFNGAYQRFCDHQGVPKEKRLGWKRVLRLMEARFKIVQVDEMRDKKRVRQKEYVGITLRDPFVGQEEEETPF